MSTPVLPDWFPRRELQRPTAEQLERADNRKRTLTYAGPNEVIPLVYGEQLVGGPIIAGPFVTGTGSSQRVVFAVALCWSGSGGVEAILDARAGEDVSAIPAITDPNTGAVFSLGSVASGRVYDGSQAQPSPLLTAAQPGFSDSFHGIAYAVIQGLQGGSNFPQLTFRVRGRKVVAPGWAPQWGGATGPSVGVSCVYAQGSTSSSQVLKAGSNGDAFRSPGMEGVNTAVSLNVGSRKINAAANVGSNTSIAVGDGGAVSRSTSVSLATWGEVTASIPITENLNFIAPTTSGGTVIVGDSGMVVRTTGPSSSLYRATIIPPVNRYAATVFMNLNMIGGEGGFVQVSEGSGTSSGYGPAIKVWPGTETVRALLRTGEVRQDISEDNRVVALGDGGMISWTADGEEWSVVDAGLNGANITHAVKWGGVMYALADSGEVVYSADGRQWRKLGILAPGSQMHSVPAGLAFSSPTSEEIYYLDPRELFGEWTENPALHMRDFVTNNEFGMAANIAGVEAAAAIADSLFSGIPRSRTGLTIQDSMTEEDALALFAQYAEVLWSYDGRDVVIIPDAPVDTVHQIEPSTIIGDSLNLSTVGLDQIPTQIRLMFSDREEPTWASRPAVAEVPAHTMHGMPTSPSSVPLPGVFNRIEAERRAYQRLMRLQTPGRIEWQMTAPGMPYQAGDVVRLPNVRGLQSVDVRLTAQPTMIAPLKYQMAGEIYSVSHYPESAEGVAVPTGGILVLRGNGAVPAGWEQMAIGDRLIREGAPGATGTVASVLGSFTLSSSGEHRGNRSNESLAMFNSPPPGTDPSQNGMPIMYVNAGGVTPAPSELHTHSFSVVFTAAEIVPRRKVRFIKRTGLPALLAPGIAFFGAENLTNLHVIESSGLLGGYVTGGATESSHGAVKSKTERTSERAGHMHNPYVCQHRWSQNSGAVSATMGQEAGEHSHSASASVTARLRSMALALFESLGDAALPEGAIVGWDGGAVPAGWALCDGSNGTVDLRERFIFITSIEQAGNEHESVSEAVLTASGETSWDGQHTHQRIFTARTPDGFIYAQTYNPYHSDVDGGHSHGVSGSVTRDLSNIQRYQLRFIQYIGE